MLNYYILDFHTWRRRKLSGAVPNPRDATCIVSMESQIFLIAGYDTAIGKYMNDIFILNTLNNKWRVHSNTVFFKFSMIFAVFMN